MPNFRFEVTAGGQSNLIEEELASIDLASPRAVELARATSTASSDANHPDSHVKVYDDAGYLIATVNFSDILKDGPADDPPLEEPGVMRSG